MIQNTTHNLNERTSPDTYDIGEDIITEKGLMRVARSPFKLKVPLEIDKDLAYLTGYHFGDGYLQNMYLPLKKRRKGGYEVSYADADTEQLKIICDIIQQKFGHNLSIFNRPNTNLWIARTSCKVLHWFLNTKLGIPMGKRKNMRIPLWIYKDKSFLSNFLSGFFDAEGDVSKTTNDVRKGKRYYIMRIQLTQRERYILEEIKFVLKSYFSIKSSINQKWNQEAYILRLCSNKQTKKFMDTISFRNPKKKEKLRALLSSFGQTYRN